MVSVQKQPFFRLFFTQYRPGKVLLRYFRTKKNPFQAMKTRSSKSRKFDIFPKGLTHGFCQEIAIFPTFFFQAIQSRKMSFAIFQNEKTPFQTIKTKSSKRLKIDNFPKELTHGFRPKMAIFSKFFFRQYRPGKCLFRYSRTKKFFLGYKRRSPKSRKIDIFPKGLTYGFGQEIAIFLNFLFQAIQAR